MKLLYVRGSVDCGSFREFVHAFEAAELAEEDRAKLQSHLDGCAKCAALLEVERSFSRGLKTRLTHAALPPGLEGRVLARLRGSSTAESNLDPKHRRASATAGYLAAAAAILLAVVAIPVALEQPNASPAQARVVAVSRRVRVVDLVCDQHGFGLEHQRACRVASHLNALKLPEGGYWAVLLDDERARDLVFNPAHRGREVVVEGSLYAAVHTLRLDAVRDVAAGGRAGTPAQAVGSAASPPRSGELATLVGDPPPKRAARGAA